jgi:hypothetical protein
LFIRSRFGPFVEHHFRRFSSCDAFFEDSVNSEVFAMQKESGESPPDSSDLEGWRKAVRSGHVAHFAPETLVAALQDLGPGLEASIREAIGQRLNHVLMGWLRGHIGHNHPNGC